VLQQLLQHTATECTRVKMVLFWLDAQCSYNYLNIETQLQHSCNTAATQLQLDNLEPISSRCAHVRTATRCSTLQHTANTATHCNTIKETATQLQHSCNKLQHTATQLQQNIPGANQQSLHTHTL